MKLGTTQQQVLYFLRKQNGWHLGCGWIWDNRSGTLRIMESLHKKGVVDKSENGRYTINEQGVAALDGVKP